MTIFSKCIHTLLATFIIGISIFSTIFLCPSLAAADFHAIIVADVMDPSIGIAVQEDLKNLQNETKRIAEYTGLKLHEKIFKIDQPELLLSHLTKLKVKKNDLLMFFYTGHGYHSDAEGDTPWPCLNFKGWKGIALKDVISICRSKKARLTLIFSNCCNATLPDWVTLPTVLKAKGTNQSLNIKNYKQLFLKSKGLIVMTSSQKGEYSFLFNGDCSLAKNGGIFTNAWLETLQKMSTSSTAEVNWTAFLTNTYSGVQKVMIDMQVAKDINPDGFVAIEGLELQQHPFFIIE